MRPTSREYRSITTSSASSTMISTGEDRLTKLIHMTLTTTSPSFKSFSVGTASEWSVLKVSGSIGPLGREWRTIRVLVFAGIVMSVYG